MIPRKLKIYHLIISQMTKKVNKQSVMSVCVDAQTL